MEHEWAMLANLFALMAAVLGWQPTPKTKDAQPAAVVSIVVAPPQK